MTTNNQEQFGGFDPVDQTDSAAGYEKNTQTADNLGQYFREIAKIPLLQAEEEVELAMRIEAGLFATNLLKQFVAGDSEKLESMAQSYDQDIDSLIGDLRIVEKEGIESKNKFIESNLRLVASLAKRYRNSEYDLLDLVQLGNEGLIRAVEKFDYQKGYKFSTYATWWIKQAITRGIANDGQTIRIPVHQVEKINKINRYIKRQSQVLGREPTNEEIATGLNMKESEVIEYRKYSRPMVSLDKPFGDSDNSQVVGDVVVDSEQPSLDDLVIHSENREIIKRLMGNVLSETQYNIVVYRYGLDGAEELTLDQIGKAMDMSAERVRQALIVARRRLKQYAELRD